MKKEYMNPDMEIARYAVEDIIRTSGNDGWDPNEDSMEIIPTT